jgi:hypothetical protein
MGGLPVSSYGAILFLYAGAAGKIKLTLQPWPAAAASPISMLAPCDPAISLTIARPKPLPVPAVPGTR